MKAEKEHALAPVATTRAKRPCRAKMHVNTQNKMQIWIDFNLTALITLLVKEQKMKLRRVTCIISHLAKV